jgi:hypothetical protein
VRATGLEGHHERLAAGELHGVGQFEDVGVQAGQDLQAHTDPGLRAGVPPRGQPGKYNRETLLTKMGEKYGIQFTDNEVRSFSVLSSLGVPVGNLKEFLSMDSESRKLVKQPGIPCDSVNNELADWVILSRVTNPKLRIAIKGDRDAHYPAIKNVLTTLIDKKVNRFNLITNMEKGS